MNPKTFQIKLRNPLGKKMKSLVGRDSYTFEIHAASHQEAFNWVVRIFSGIDMEKSSGLIVDCDALKKFQNINGKRFAIEKPEGYYRASPEEVAIGLYKLIEALKEDYAQFLRNVKLYTTLSEQFGEKIHRENLSAAKEGARLAKVWLDNLLKEFPSHCYKEPMREEVRQALLAAVSEIAAQF
jgi:hypothetical protein